MPVSDWLGVLQNLGLPVAIIVFAGWGVVVVARWLAPRIDRLITRLIDSVDEVSRLDTRLTAVEARLDTMWGFQLKHAAADAVSSSVGTINSPLIVTDEARSWLDHLAPELRDWYAAEGQGLSNVQLAEEVERRWGERILHSVCVPRGVSHGAGVLIAISVARSGSPVPLAPQPQAPEKGE